MKDMKTLITGFLLATCMFLMMGQGIGITPIVNLTETGNGRYQLSTTMDEDLHVYETIMDTRKAEIIYRNKIKLQAYNGRVKK